ncbi:MAG: right-handed parallel beta-helix repeat-containing protein [Lentisphaerae bacterium]|nr:right-handed parallel beta-helix repeat-containing protein [Lentisphaerota bacterium]
MKSLLAAILVVCSAVSSYAAGATVKASQFGYDRQNATKCLQAAFDSDAETVIIDQVGAEWLAGGLYIKRDNLTIVFAEGVTLRALPGAFPKRPDAFIAVTGRKNITFIGQKDSQVTMNKEEYRQIDARFQGGHRHAFRLMNNDGVTFRGMTITSSGGDGIYVGHGCRNVLIEDTSCLNHARQGISVISCENLLIRNCHFDNTSGTPPEAGIDFEPNLNNECLIHCVLENSTFNGNAGSGFTAYLPNLDGSSRPVSITVRNCEFNGNNSGAMVSNKRQAGNLLLGTIAFENCRIAGSKTINMRVADVGEGFSFAMTDCTIDNTGQKQEALTFTSSTILSPDIGNIAVKNLRVIDDQPGRAPVRFQPLFGCGVNKDVQVDVTINGEKYDVAPVLAMMPPSQREKIELTKETLDGLVAPTVTGDVHNPKVPTLNLRGSYTLLLLAKKGDQFSIWVKAEPVVPGRKPAKTTFELKDPKNKTVESITMMTDGSEKTITATAAQDGMYKFLIRTAGQRASVWSDHPGQGLVASPDLAMISPRAKLYFEVPAGVVDTVVVFSGASAVERIKEVSLLDAAGNIVQTAKDTEAALLRIKRPADAKAEVWCLDIGGTVEDCHVLMGKGLKPVLATSPDLLLRASQK